MSEPWSERGSLFTHLWMELRREPDCRLIAAVLRRKRVCASAVEAASVSHQPANQPTNSTCVAVSCALARARYLAFVVVGAAAAAAARAAAPYNARAERARIPKPRRIRENVFASARPYRFHPLVLRNRKAKIEIYLLTTAQIICRRARNIPQ